MQSHIRKKLLEAFAQAGEAFISGQKIAEITGASRTAVWKHIEDLRKDGYELEAVRRKGYRIVSVPNKMSADSIRLHLQTKTFGQHLHFVESIDSTQKLAKELANNDAEEGTLVVADEQTSGRGRLARQWSSPKGKGVWMSLVVKPNIPLIQAPQLTLLTAVAVAQAIEEVIEAKPQIKWPNDILLDGKKVTGILTEMQAESDRIHSIIIGIGINVNQSENDFLDELREIATSLCIQTGQVQSREQVLNAVLTKLERLYEVYCSEGFTPIKVLWESYAISVGKIITATTPQQKIVGEALGITDQGVLLMRDAQNVIHSIYSADIEL